MRRRLSVPRHHYARKPALVPVACARIVNAPRGANKAKMRLAGRGADFFASSRCAGATQDSSRTRNHLAATDVSNSRLRRHRADLQEIRDEQNQGQDRGAAGWLPAAVRCSPRPPSLLALLALPDAGHAQGIVRGAQEGSYEGNRVAGPVGGVVGGAVGAGVGGAMGAVKGVLGIPNRGIAAIAAAAITTATAISAATGDALRASVLQPVSGLEDPPHQDHADGEEAERHAEAQGRR